MPHRYCRVVIALIAVAWFATRAEAQFVVDTTVDEVDATPGDGVCATAAGACSLRAALAEANVRAVSSSISLPSGVYVLTRGSLGISALRTLTIAGAGAASTIIDGNGLSTVFSTSTAAFFGGAGTQTVSGVTVRNGRGCFSMDTGTIVIANAVVTACGGTGVRVSGFPGYGALLRVIDTIISDNVRTDGVGAGIHADFGGSVEVVRGTIARNVSQSGAGVYIVGRVAIGSRTTLSIRQSKVENNVASAGGGGIAVLGAVEATVTESTLSGNRASSGSGVYASAFDDEIYYRGQVLVTRSAIVRNSATGANGGAGLYVGAPVFPSPEFVRVRLVNTTVSGNEALVAAGGALTVAQRGMVSLTNVTIADNGSASGGAITGSPLVLAIENTIVARNGGANCSLATPITDSGYNLEFPGASCAFTLPTDRHADPLLEPLTDNGGETQTQALGRGSPAIDAGNGATCHADPVSGVDQRGFVRPAACDIGAYESGAPWPAFSDASLIAGATPVRAIHFTELRTRINVLRRRFGLQTFAWTDVSLVGVPVRAEHLQQLRQALHQAYAAAIDSGVSVSPPVFTDDPAIPGQSIIRARHIEELRAAVVLLESY